jgi:hypothetical protein
MATLINYRWPAHLPASAHYRLSIKGKPTLVHTCRAADFAIFSFEGSVELELTVIGAVDGAQIHPLSRHLAAEIAGDTLRFSLDRPGHLMIEIPGFPELFLYANPPERDVPSPDDPNVLFFKAGQVYDVGRLTIEEDNQTVYIEGGAVLKGCFNAFKARNVTLRGRGIMDASFYPHHAYRMLVFEGCQNVELEGIVTVGTPSWNTVFGACDGVHVDNYKTLGWVMCSDGIDIVGSRDVLIENCCLRSNDDCVAVKSVAHSNGDGSPPRLDWRGEVQNVEVRNCVLYNDVCGNALEIGFETQTDSIRDIRFRDLDILYSHGHGGVFTIHNGDRAVIEEVLYENIRVQHYFDKLVDLRIMHSRYSQDESRGHIRNVRFRDIDCVANEHNSCTLIGGSGPNHRVEAVVFEDFRIGGRTVESLGELEAFVNYAEGIEFASRTEETDNRTIGQRGSCLVD